LKKGVKWSNRVVVDGIDGKKVEIEEDWEVGYLYEDGNLARTGKSRANDGVDQ
jgi:hypothetical protein